MGYASRAYTGAITKACRCLILVERYLRTVKEIVELKFCDLFNFRKTPVIDVSSAKQFLQPFCVSNGIAASIVVEIHVNIQASPFPLPSAIRPPAQVVLRI